MHIWLINHYAVPPKYYPLARQANFAKYLMAMGHTVTIFAASSVHNSSPALNLINDGAPYREETVDGTHYVYIKCCDYAGSGLKRVYNMCEFAWKLPGVCKKFPRPDAIVSTSVPPTSCAVGVWLARKWGARAVAEIADLWPESIVAYGIAGPRNPVVVALRWLEKWIYTRADKVVFTMEGAYDYILEQGWEKDIPREKVHYINNGVDLAQFQHNVTNYVAEDGDLADKSIFKVVYTGSVRPANNVGLLLDAAKKVKNPRVRFLIWGDGDERPALEQRLRDENITNVIFKGRVQKSFVPSVVSQADVNFLDGWGGEISRFGASPNKLFDYFAAGKPILAEAIAKYDPTAPYGCALYYSDADTLAQSIDRLSDMDSEQLATMSQGSQAAAHDFDFRYLTERLEKILQEDNA